MMDARIAELESRIIALEAGGPDRVLTTREVAAQLGMPIDKLQGWLKSPELRRRHRVDEFMFKRGGERVSTPRLMAAWVDWFSSRRSVRSVS